MTARQFFLYRTQWYKACPVTSRRSNIIDAVISGSGSMFITIDNHAQACSVPYGFGPLGGWDTIIEVYSLIIPDILFRNWSCFSAFPSESYVYPKALLGMVVNGDEH
jgi:hypothetical protein